MSLDKNLNYSADISHINTVAEWVNKHGAGMVTPEYFYDKMLLDTIRIDTDQFVYYRIAKETPIQGKADKLVLRRWAPLEGHTIPLMEGIPPKSDKSSLEKYEISANQYGRYMEFSDKVSWNAIDPVLTHYTHEYTKVVMETLDMLARETLFSIAQKFYAGDAANFEEMTVDGSVPKLDDLRLIVLGLQRALVEPVGGAYHVIASPEFYFDMVDDPRVEKYMNINQTTYSVYSKTALPAMFGMEFYETLVCPESGDFVSGGVLAKRMYRLDAAGTAYEYKTWLETDTNTAGDTMVTIVDGYVKDSRTGQDASFIPQQKIWDTEAYNTEFQGSGNPWTELRVQHVLVHGKDALTRTGLAGEGQSKMITKPLGSSGVLDPVDQRQSIGFKINSVGFGSTRLEAVVDYVCIPTECNQV